MQVGGPLESERKLADLTAGWQANGAPASMPGLKVGRPVGTGKGGVREPRGSRVGPQGWSIFVKFRDFGNGSFGGSRQ